MAFQSKKSLRRDLAEMHHRLTSSRLRANELEDKLDDARIDNDKLVTSSERSATRLEQVTRDREKLEARVMELNGRESHHKWALGQIGLANAQIGQLRERLTTRLSIEGGSAVDIETYRDAVHEAEVLGDMNESLKAEVLRIRAAHEAELEARGKDLEGLEGKVSELVDIISSQATGVEKQFSTEEINSMLALYGYMTTGKDALDCGEHVHRAYARAREVLKRLTEERGGKLSSRADDVEPVGVVDRLTALEDQSDSLHKAVRKLKGGQKVEATLRVAEDKHLGSQILELAEAMRYPLPKK